MIRCSLILLRSDKLSVFPHVVVVFISQRLGLPTCDKAHKPVYENVLHYRVGVRTRLLLAGTMRPQLNTKYKRLPIKEILKNSHLFFCLSRCRCTTV